MQSKSHSRGYYTNAKTDENIPSVMTPKNSEAKTSRVWGSEYSRDYMLQTLSLCTQEAAKPVTLGQYIVTSKELTRAAKSDEIHIITNELYNYDFTPLSSLAIAVNTKKGVHYYYYGDKHQKAVFNELKQTIIDYYLKSYKARTAVVAWIRMRKSSYIDFEKFFNTYSIAVSNVFFLLLGSTSLLPEKINQIITDYCAITNLTQDQELISHTAKNNLLEWVTGSVLMDNPLRRVYRTIDNIKRISDSVSEFRSFPIVKDFCEKATCLYNMKTLSRWQSENCDINPSTERIDELIDFFSSAGPNNEEIIPDTLREWLLPEEDEVQSGIAKIDEADINGYLRYLHFCVLEDGKPYTLCYNFSFFICAEGPAACWYITYSSATNNRATAKADVDLLMIDIAHNNILLPRIKSIFRVLIQNNKGVEEELEKCKSRLINYL